MKNNRKNRKLIFIRTKNFWRRTFRPVIFTPLPISEEQKKEFTDKWKEFAEQPNQNWISTNEMPKVEVIKFDQDKTAFRVNITRLNNLLLKHNLIR